MTRTIPAHIEDGRVIPDAPMPDGGEIVDVSIVVRMAEPPASIDGPRDDGPTLGFARLFEMFRAARPEPKAGDMRTWLDEIEPIRERIRQREGFLPDSAIDIAEDRMTH